MATTPQRLSHRHELIVLLAARGMRRAEIAERLGYYPTTVSAIMRCPAFKRGLAQLQAEIRARTVASLAERILEPRSAVVRRASG